MARVVPTVVILGLVCVALLGWLTREQASDEPERPDVATISDRERLGLLNTLRAENSTAKRMGFFESHKLTVLVADDGTRRDLYAQQYCDQIKLNGYRGREIEVIDHDAYLLKSQHRVLGAATCQY